MVAHFSVSAPVLALMVFSSASEHSGLASGANVTPQVSLEQLQLMDRSLGEGVFAMIDTDHDGFLNSAELQVGVLAGLLPS